MSVAAAAVTAAGSLAASGIAAGYNISSNTSARHTQEEMFREEMDYQKQLNQIIMDRQDTALQRAVADAKAAGLSPLAVTGSPADSSLSSAMPGIPNIQPAQVDPNTFQDALRGLQQAYMQENQFKHESEEAEKNRQHDQFMQNDEQAFQMAKTAAELNATSDIVGKQIASAEKIAKENNETSAAIADANRKSQEKEGKLNRAQAYQLCLKQLADQAETTNINMYLQATKDIKDNLKQVYPGIQFHECDSPEELKEWNDQWSISYGNMLVTANNVPQNSSSSKATTSNASGGVSVVKETGVNAFAGLSQSDAYSADISNIINAEQSEWVSKHPYGILTKDAWIKYYGKKTK